MASVNLAEKPLCPKCGGRHFTQEYRLSPNSQLPQFGRSCIKCGMNFGFHSSEQLAEESLLIRSISAAEQTLKAQEPDALKKFMDQLTSSLQDCEPANTAKIPLAKKHTGMRISAQGLLVRAQGGSNPLTSDQKFMLGELHEHLEELATRFYAGDLTVVDEFLQLYSLSKERRPKEGKSNG